MTSTHEAFREWMMLSREAASIITISDGEAATAGCGTA
jgi:hypothetical protein